MISIMRRERKQQQSRTHTDPTLDGQREDNIVRVDRFRRSELRSSPENDIDATVKRPSLPNVVRINRNDMKLKRKKGRNRRSFIDGIDPDKQNGRERYLSENKSHLPTIINARRGWYESDNDEELRSASAMYERGHSSFRYQNVIRLLTSSTFVIPNKSSKSIKTDRRSSLGQFGDFTDAKKRKKDNLPWKQICCLCLPILICFILAGVISAIVAFTIIPKKTATETTVTTTTTSTTATTDTTTTTTACPIMVQSVLLSLNGTTPSTWTQYNLTFVANSSSHAIFFGFQSSNNREYYLDDVSLFDNTAPSIELLSNNGFENSTGIATGWTQWCTSMCSSTPGHVYNGTQCRSGQNCFYDPCPSLWGMDFLSQSFTTNTSQTYTISFYLKKTGSGVITGNSFYAFVI